MNFQGREARVSPKLGRWVFLFGWFGLFFFVGLVLMYFSRFQVPRHKQRRGYRIRGKVDLSTETLTGPQGLMWTNCWAPV